MSFEKKLEGMVKEGATLGRLGGIKLSAPQVQQLCEGIQKKGDARGLEQLSLWGCGLGDGGSRL